MMTYLHLRFKPRVVGGDIEMQPIISNRLWLRTENENKE